MSEVRALNHQNFQEQVGDYPGPVLVDFWAVWCGPCRMVSPVVDQVARTFDGQVKVLKCNVDENVELAARYQITGIPTLLLFKNGAVVDQVVGYVDANRLAERVNKVLLSA